jgi:hypothetical protein
VVKLSIFLMTIPLLIAGCASEPPEPIPTPIEVKLPISVHIYCSGSKLDKPALSIAKLKADSSPADTIRAYAATVAILKGAVKERDAALAGCAAPASAPTRAAATLSQAAGANGDSK